MGLRIGFVMTLLPQDRDRKTLEVQQWQQECERLQDLNERMKAPTDLLRGDRQHLTKAYKELQFTESECQQLLLENEELHIENKQLNKSLSQLQERCLMILLNL